MVTTKKIFVPKKLTISLVLFCFLLTQVVGGILLYAKPAKAQLVVTDPVTGAQTTVKNVKDFLKIVVVNGGIMAMINAASNFTQKIAYDLAVSLVSGGGGEMPLFSTEGWGDYFENAALDAAGEFIGSFGDMFGVNLCAPPNPQVGLSIQLGLSEAFGDEGPTPRCEWSQIQSNWEGFIAEVQTEDFLRQMASQFQIGYNSGTDFDLAMTGFIGAFGVQQSASEEAKLTREEGQGFLPSTELISGQVKTPAEIIRQTSEMQTQGPVDAENIKTGLSGQAMSAGAEGILMQFVSTFLNTLLSKTMDRLFSDGFYSLADLFPSGGGVRDEEGTAWGGRKAAELSFADFLTPQIKEGGAVDILAQFVVCPEKFRSQNNCVLDGQFEAAVRRAQTGEPLTVSQAIKQNLLHANWPLIPPTDTANNQDPFCYTKAYCYSNLVKMRKARIIPIGWEIAALASTSDRPVRLGEVVSKFYDCNDEDKADALHPYCHLVDPNWILKAPPEQCRAKVYGPVLQTAENSFRQEVCVDAPTCIAEDDNGNCEGGWANCLREKNIWRLNGDKCDAQYDTCRALKRRDGEQVSYLINTIDNGPPCTSEDIGCRWYSTAQSKSADVWQWQDRLSDEGSGTTRSDRIFFNKNIVQCDEPGCNEFLRTTKESRLNLVVNSGFEDISGIPPVFSNWSAYGVTAEPSADTYFGQKALKLTGSVTQTINLGSQRGGRTFVLSLHAKNCGETSSTDYFTFGGVPVPGGNFENTPSFQRLIGPTHTFLAGDTGNTIEVLIRNEDADCLIDAVQLEEAASSSSYHAGWGRTGEALYLKSAPDYYACYDYNSDGSLNKANDADSCKDFSKACEEKDVGCEKFTPANGDPWIPGVASYPDDYCPQECVGYQTFKQVGTDFEQEKFPVYFIPATARTCSAADAGCDQFTSLEDEAVANFSGIRRCEKPSTATSATFYTWEGSDTSGYQLKNWNLKISNLNEIIIDRSPAGGVGPCTRLDPADSTRCADDRSAGTCTKADTLATNPDGSRNPSYNPDCREFYDSAGNKHYRLYSKTIIATDDCHPYRKTISNSADCGISGGKWDGTKNECTYQVYLPETRVCSAASVGCRAYRGNAGANVSIILNDNFDDGTTSGWSSGSSSSESLTVGGKSLAVSTTAGTTASKSVAGTVRKGGIYTLSFWAKGDSKLDIKFSNSSADKYFSVNDTNPATPTAELSFDWRYFSLGPVYVTWDPALDEKLQITPSGGTMANIYIDNIVLREVQDYVYLVKNSWTTPDSCDRTFLIDYTATNSANCSAAGGAWTDQTSECIVSAALPQAQLGCALYRDRASRDHYLKSFSRLCSPEAAGCEKLIKTQNNTTTAAEELNKGNDSDPSLSVEERLSDNVKIPADTLAFLIVDDTYKCRAESKGCADFGSPTLDASGNVKVGEDGKPQYDAVSLLADPAKYTGDTGKILCEVQYQGCEEYATTEGGTLYFKDPGVRTCEWKENITVEGRSVSGWFKKGTNPAEPCDPMAFYGGTYNIWKNGDIRCTLPNVCNNKCTLSTACTSDTGCKCEVGGSVICRVDKGQTACGYDCSCSVDTTPGATGIAGSSCTVSYGKRTCPYSGWVGECPATANMCTKFVDPSDIKTSGEGEPYYYIKNNKLTPGNCNGMVSQRDGCVLLNDTSVTQLSYNANATYASSENKSGDPGGTVAPVDCNKTPRDPGCKRCLNIEVRDVCTGYDFIGGIRRCVGTMSYTDYHYGNQCQKDSECSEKYAESDPAIAGRDGEGCKTIVPNPTVVMEKIIFDSFPKNVNDSNTLLKVRRDRVCGEWLDCTSTNSTFDSQTGRQKTLCEELGVCNSYNKTGEATKCIDWVDEPDTYRKILTKDLYTSRDTTWSGMEYTGDSVYNQYQAADLVGVNIGTEANPKNILAFIVGIDPNNPDNEICFNVSGNERGCGADPKGYCDSIVNGSACRFADGTFAGKCYNNLCVTNFRGDPLNPGTPLLVEDKPESVSCRAYPEQSSPFPTSVVSAWSSSGQDIKSKKPGFAGANVCEKQRLCTSGPQETKFCQENADCGICSGGTDPGSPCDADSDCPGTGSSCLAGECAEVTDACECNYKKVSYSGGAVTKYFSSDLKSDYIPHVCIGGTTPGKICKPDALVTDATWSCGGRRTCAGGTSPGSKCVQDIDCPGDPATTSCQSEAQCVEAQREDASQGWFGYCLERDTSISINGDPEKYACLSWYPIDQLPGLPDVYNQYTEAGFPLGNSYYCAETNVYRNLSPVGFGANYDDNTKHECAELGDGCGGPYDDCYCDDTFEEARDYCAPNVNCGPGYFALLLACDKEGEVYDYHEWCEDSTGDNDCPYRCVPLSSHRTTDDTLCQEPVIKGDITPRYVGLSNSGTRVWYVGYEKDDINAYFDDYKNCRLEGWSETNPPSAPVGVPYRKYSGHTDPYFGCSWLVQVANSDPDPGESNKAWTDRTWQSGDWKIKTDVRESILGYIYATMLAPFGRGIGTPATDFYSIPTCHKTSSPGVISLTTAEPDLACQTSFEKYPESGTGLTVPNEARAYNYIERRETTGSECTTAEGCNNSWYCSEVMCLAPCEDDGDCTAEEGRCADGYCELGPKLSDTITEPAGNPAYECSLIHAAGGARLPSGTCLNTHTRAKSGISCDAHADCRIYNCVSGFCVETAGGVPEPETAGEDAYEAIGRINQLFAQRYSAKNWKIDIGSNITPEAGASYNETPGYIPNSDTSKSGDPADAPGGEGWPDKPRIYALGGCIGDKCKQGTENTVTVNGIDGDGLATSGLTERKNAVGYGGKLKVTMQFFGRADKNAMPIIDVATNWGDESSGAVRSRPGKYKNHLGLKENNETWCDNENFGRSTEACTDQYFMFTHTYSCPAEWAENTAKACTGAPETWGNQATGCFASSCPEDLNGAADGNGSCCVFKPKVQIKDNWGWCNGSCGRGGTGGCYDGGGAIGATNECDTGETRYDHWTSFQGQVIVVPK